MPVNPEDIAISSDETAPQADNLSEYEGEMSEDPFRELQLISDPDAVNDAPPSVSSSGDDIEVEGTVDLNGSEGGYRLPRDTPPSRNRRGLSNLHTGPNWEQGTPRDPSSKAPTLDEWANFFSKVVLRTACSWYIGYAFTGVDEDMLTDREIDRLAMTDDERRLISTPLAELANKSKLMRKYGRSIVSGGDAFNSLVVLGMWMSRVNRIAAKYKPRQTRMRMNGQSPNGNSRTSPQAGTAAQFTEGTTGGRVANGYPVFNPGGS